MRIFKCWKYLALACAFLLSSCQSYITSPNRVLSWTISTSYGVQGYSNTVKVCGTNYKVGDTVKVSYTINMKIDFSQLTDEMVKVELRNNRNSDVYTHVFRYQTDTTWSQYFAFVQYEITSAKNLGEIWMCSGNLTEYTRTGHEYKLTAIDSPNVSVRVYYSAK